MLIRALFFLSLLFSTSGPVLAKDSLLVYGEGFSFSVSEPKGWHCDCDGKLAATVGANIAFWKKGEDFQSAQPLIYLRVNPRGKDPADDLYADISSVKSRTPEMTFEDFKVEAKGAQSKGKIFRNPGKAVEYVVYSPEMAFGQQQTKAVNRLSKTSDNAT